MGGTSTRGFGGIDPGAILNTDPSQFPDENPLAQKQGGSSPTPEEVQQYADGVVDPTDIVNDSSYTYRGFDESKLKDGLNVYPDALGHEPALPPQVVAAPRSRPLGDSPTIVSRETSVLRPQPTMVGWGLSVQIPADVA